MDKTHEGPEEVNTSLVVLAAVAKAQEGLSNGLAPTVEACGCQANGIGVPQAYALVMAAGSTTAPDGRVKGCIAPISTRASIARDGPIGARTISLVGKE